MAGYNGELSFGIQPLDFSTSNLAGTFFDNNDNYLKSVNDPLRYQIQWFNGNSLKEDVEPSAANFTGLPSSTTVGNGDIVNVVFKVYTTTNKPDIFPTQWNLIGTIKKSRDMINTQKAGYFGNSTEYNPPKGHRFTIDVSQLVADELSYSLCPINKGTWNSNYFGGMNGGLTMQDNVLNHNQPFGTPVSQYNVSPNGTFRLLRVQACFEIINGAGEIVSIDHTISSSNITVINSVNQFEKDSLYYSKYNMDTSASTKYSFLSRCPNAQSGFEFMKPIRVDEQAEYLQFYMRAAASSNIRGGGSTDSNVGNIGLKVETFRADDSLQHTFYLRDFEDNCETLVSGSSFEYIKPYQDQMFIQNVSPYYIKNTPNLIGASKKATIAGTFPYWNAYTGDTITDSTAWYRVSMSRFALFTNPVGGGYEERRTGEYRFFIIDREDEKIPYGFVRFHWLNSLGGIDSYTAKRDVVEGLTINRDVIERKSGDRTWYQNDKGGNGNGGSDIVQPYVYKSDTMRGGDIYKGGREVTNINAERLQSVYTEPLNKSAAKWLEEMMLSPNVWIEMDTEATEMGNDMNDYLRPSDIEYIPVIITNSDVETVNQAEGLVKFNIEYTLAHKVITQRN
tara:strand:+ start:198 stop:2057 length:1860 start_codon:yes stop_codon:yes gene_type:complete